VVIGLNLQLEEYFAAVKPMKEILTEVGASL
jgi:hypothetical protein